MHIETKIQESVATWKNLTSDITEQWIREYFDWSEDEEVNFDWVNNDVGGVFEVSDYYFHFSNVIDCYRYSVTKEDLIKWYDFCLDNQSVHISLAKFILSPEERKEAEEKHLVELKERVELAEKEFKKAIENYENRN